MRQEPIEIAMVGATARQRLNRRTRTVGSPNMKSEPRIVDEAFAGFDGAHCSTSHGQTRDRRMMKQALVTDLVAQLEAIDRQRARLARLLQSVETNSITD